MKKFDKEEAVGKWLSIFRCLGIEVREDGKHGTCPLCGKEGKWRFEDNGGSGNWFCTCSAGDGWKLIQEKFSVNFADALDVVSGVIGSAAVVTPREKKLITSSELRKMFEHASLHSKGDLVDIYLGSRGLKARPDVNVWYQPKAWHSETKSNHNAMMVIFHSAEGQAVAFHRTYLNADGDKLESVEKNKKMSPAMVPTLCGGASRILDIGESKTLGLGEGIETTLALSEIMDIPAWALTTEALMRSFELPDIVNKQVDHFVIAVDNDRSFTGQKAAFSLARKLRVKYKKTINLLLPINPGCDVLDCLAGTCDYYFL